MSLFSIQIDPHVVLDVAPGATLQEIREAYRQQAKRYHPDAGGADWAHHILVWAYEVLSTDRVAQATRAEFARRRPAVPQSRDVPPDLPEPEVGEEAVDPSRQVGVEKLWVRYESDPHWFLHEAAPEDQSVSCSLNFKWPDAGAEQAPVGTPEGERILGQLAEVFEMICVKTRVATSRIKVRDDVFSGWIAYPNVERAEAAYRQLHALLSARGFGVTQCTRELVLPRAWR